MANNIDNSALYTISYGLYALITRSGEKDNACIVNTAIQVTSEPLRLIVTVNKQNYTHDILLSTREANICVLSQSADFSLFKRFGFQSGREADKFAGLPEIRLENGIRTLDSDICAVMSLKVASVTDLVTHSAFLCDIAYAEKLSGDTPMTYSYYHQNVKPKPDKKVKGYVCGVCGYIYEGDPLPEDFICPICKHGREVFEPLT